MIKLSKRLAAVLELIPTADCIADVGTDHGYLAVALIKEKKAHRVIAIDVHKGPLSSAQAYIKSENLEEQIECRLSDGLQQTSVGELDGAVLCGMGGFLMKNIISEGPEKLGFYVLQPQNGQAELRQYMVAKGYSIIKEELVEDMGKLYEYMLVSKECIPTPYDDLPVESILWQVGALLEKERPLLWKKHWQRLLDKKIHILEAMETTETDRVRYEHISLEIAELKALEDNR